MSEHMNPDYPKQRGCFIDVNKKTGTCVVVDYPTWSFKHNRTVYSANAPIPDDLEYKREFNTTVEAYDFCKSENYGVCSFPKTDAELEELRKKRYANKNENNDFDDEFDY